MHLRTGNCVAKPTGDVTGGATRPAGTLEHVQNSHRLALNRRQLLIGSAGAALLVAGCSTAAPRLPEPAPIDPLQELLDEQVALERTYRLARVADADPVLHSLADNASEHVLALANALAMPAPTADSSPSATSDATATHAPTDPAQLRVLLRDGETLAAARCVEAALHAPRERVALLAALSASHHCAAQVLA